MPEQIKDNSLSFIRTLIKERRQKGGVPFFVSSPITTEEDSRSTLSVQPIL
ncbi:hypothetical protein HUK48_09310 [Prevotella corporis]|uniref:hypothetical protein n=1 Tax=Prevotella corporis TaxID=28128 RepID=UPI00041200AF|nr:hypothetical protein [Prevotella corporis]MDQ7737571.1 hypothetical protein [Prevotella corporis]